MYSTIILLYIVTIYTCLRYTNVTPHTTILPLQCRAYTYPYPYPYPYPIRILSTRMHYRRVSSASVGGNNTTVQIMLLILCLVYFGYDLLWSIVFQTEGLYRLYIYIEYIYIYIYIYIYACNS